MDEEVFIWGIGAYFSLFVTFGSFFENYYSCFIVRSEDKKKEKELKTEKYNKVLEKQDLLVPSKKQLKKAIENYFKEIIKPYFEMKHLDEFLDGNFQYTPNDIQECYRKIKNENRELMIDLLLQRKQGKITNQEMSVLYNILLQN